MPPINKKKISQNRNILKKPSTKYSLLIGFYRKYINFNFVKYLFFDPCALPIVTVFIILAELILNIIVIQNVPYTEIDWIAYMQECEGFINGTTNYALLKGDTGPLVYPAGFLYIYTLFYLITSHGNNIRLAQYIFCIIYLIQLWLVLRLYSKTCKVPPYVLLLSIFTSYRIHSIYILRLFNDPLAILFLYIALNFFFDQKWTLGSIFYSFGIGIKMNLLLISPSILLLYITNLGYQKTIQQLFICGLIQIIIGLPFLLTYPIEYFHGSFNFGRIFDHKWTVNYRFLNKNLFENHIFHLFLLIIHLCLLILFAKPTIMFFKNYYRLRELQQQLQPQIQQKNLELKKKKDKIHNSIEKEKLKENEKEEEKLTKEQMNFLNSFEKGLKLKSGEMKSKNEIKMKNEKYFIQFDKCTQLIMLPILLCNFIGIICARSLHYQFYVWYFHSLPYLTWSTDYSLGMKYLLLGLIEFCWNTYPSTNFSSALLHLCHFILLYGVGRKIFNTTNYSKTILSNDVNDVNDTDVINLNDITKKEKTEKSLKKTHVK